jgi:hypothetical protein
VFANFDVAPDGASVTALMPAGAERQPSRAITSRSCSGFFDEIRRAMAAR